MVTSVNELEQPAGAPSSYEMAGLDCTIIMHPQVWKVSGHHDLFVDQMVDCRESNKRYRYDQILGRWVSCENAKTTKRAFVTSLAEDDQEADIQQRALKLFNLRSKHADQLQWDSPLQSLDTVDVSELPNVLAPDSKELGTLTEPRDFNLMFKTVVGALGDAEKDAAFFATGNSPGYFR